MFAVEKMTEEMRSAVLPMVDAFYQSDAVSHPVGQEKQEQTNTADATIDSLKRVIAQTQNESNDLMGTIEQIQEGFRQINEAEGRISSENSQGEGSDRQAILENMAFIQSRMQQNRELIANLREQLRASSRNNTQMKGTLEEMVANFEKQLNDKSRQIDSLRSELQQRDVRIAEQDEQITALNENVTNLSSANEQKTRAMAAQEQELNTAYYVFGTKKELREQNILKRNDVLKSDDFNKDYFTKIDIRVTKVIKLYSKKAELKTSHPAGSYTLDKDAQGQYTLRITNPQSFWSVSRYLVIVVR